MYIFVFVCGCVLFFIIGILFGIYINAKGMAKEMKAGRMYIKRNGKWHPRNPHTVDDKNE